MNSIQKETVYVGLSGGVDSSVTALRLLQQGYKVVGVFIKVWHPEFLPCNWEVERLDAMRVAAWLGIPFVTCDAENDYRDKVAKLFIDQYSQGLTPNPDIWCNTYVKFGTFFEFARKNKADKIATGHYAQIKNVSGQYQLHRGVDRNKDQSYFLWQLSEEKLSFTLFPIGDSDKDTIRKEALQAGLPTAHKPDSQGICFLGQINIKEFLSHYIDLKQGPVIDIHGEEVGTHHGALIYTLGQRHGFTIDSKHTAKTPFYVVGKNIETNTLTVNDKPKTTNFDEQFILESCNWINDRPNENDSILIQFRHRQKPISTKIKSLDHNQAVVIMPQNCEQPASGQSCVVYSRDGVCFGGGVIV